jgi:choloylglycine hydrolase
MHILKSAEQQKGCVRIGEGYEITQYSSCINADRGRMYFTTYGNSRISVVDMNKEDLDSDDPISFPMDDRQDFDELNACVKCGHGRRSPSCRP